MFVAHNYEPMLEEERPQDPNLDGTGLIFKTLEHGGEFPDAMPQAIRVTDSEGRSCIYVAIQVNGKVVNSKGYVTDNRPQSYAHYDLKG